MVTLNDIAAKLGISKSTVSKGLNNASDVSEELRRKILQTATEMGYTGRRGPKKLCILVENMGYTEPNQFGHDIIAGFLEMAQPEGWMVDVVPLTKEFQSTAGYERFVSEGGWRGVFALGFSLIDPWMKEFPSTQIPTVLYDNYIKENPRVASVDCDSGGGLEAAVRHLYCLGHRRIGLLSGPLDSYVMKERYSSYCGALEACGLSVDEDLIGMGYYVAESTRKYLPRLMEKGATAILCGNDLLAVGVVRECERLHIRIPQDLSVVGFDNLPISAEISPALTTINQDRIDLGRNSYATLYWLIAKVPISRSMLRPCLIVRDSTGQAASEETKESR